MTDTTVDVDLTLSKTPPRPALVSSRIAVAGVALEHALGAVGRRLLERGRGQAVIIEVPSPQWVEPVATSVRLLAGRTVDVVTKGKSADALSTLSEGGNVVGVAHDPHRSLPAGLVRVADHRFVIPPLDVDLLREAMKRCLIGIAPTSLRNLSVAGIDFDLLCATMPKGTRKRDAVARIEAITEHRPAPVKQGLKLPRLEDAIEYGAARSWGLELARDFHDLRAGRIGPHEIDSGCVFYSAPGLGKTSLSTILAEACGVPLYMTSISELFATSSGHLDAVIKALHKVFATAQAAAPCILWFDEISALPNEASISRSHNRDYWLPLITEFYLLLDSTLHRRDGVVVIGSTNSPDLSAALTRNQRLERVIEIRPPSAAGLANVLRTQLGTDLAGADLMPIATAGEGATPATASGWVRSARRRARRAGRAMILEDLDAQVFSLDPRSPHELHRTAVHEAGHAVIGELMGLEMVSVSIRRIGASGGRVTFAEDINPVVTLANMAGRLRMILAGRAAERIICGDLSGGAGGGDESDLAQATAIVAQIRGSYGLRDSLRWVGPPDAVTNALAFDVDLRRAVEKDLKSYERETLTLVRRYRAKINQLARDLLANALTVRAMPSNAASSSRSSPSSVGSSSSETVEAAG